MLGSARIDIQTLLQHVSMRGLKNRRNSTGMEYGRRFVERFSALRISTETDNCASALLDNQLHLPLRPRQTPLAKLM